MKNQYAEYRGFDIEVRGDLNQGGRWQVRAIRNLSQGHAVLRPFGTLFSGEPEEAITLMKQLIDEMFSEVKS